MNANPLKDPGAPLVDHPAGADWRERKDGRSIATAVLALMREGRFTMLLAEVDGVDVRVTLCKPGTNEPLERVEG